MKNNLCIEDLVNSVRGYVYAQDQVGAILDALKTAMEKGQTINLRGFGSFKPLTRKARKGVNPRTGEEISIPKTRTYTFKISPSLKEKLNK